METIIYLMVLSVFLELLYFIYEDKVKRFKVFIYAIIIREIKDKAYYKIELAKFFISIGSSISAVSVVGLIIPIKDVTIGVKIIVFVLGLFITLMGAFSKKILEKND